MYPPSPPPPLEHRPVPQKGADPIYTLNFEIMHGSWGCRQKAGVCSGFVAPFRSRAATVASVCLVRMTSTVKIRVHFSPRGIPSEMCRFTLRSFHLAKGRSNAHREEMRLEGVTVCSCVSTVTISCIHVLGDVGGSLGTVNCSESGLHVSSGVFLSPWSFSAFPSTKLCALP